MDADWDEVVRVPLPPPGLRAHATPVSTLSFDTSQELLWAGNEYGRVCSFYGTRLEPYTSFKAHNSQDGKIHQLLFNDKGVIALGSRSVHMAVRRGPPLWTIRHESMKELRCMTFTSKGTAEILVAGEQDTMLVIDVNKGEVIKVLPADTHYKIMRRSRFICAATTGSSVHIIDPLTFKVNKSWTPHAGTVHDMDAQHDFIVTCGATPRQQGFHIFDPFVNVFDLKNMVPMSPLPFPAGAAYVRMHPRMSTTSIVVSQYGQIFVLDLMNPSTTSLRQANTASYLHMVDIAPSGEALALADASSEIHLWGSQSKIHFAELPTPLEVADQAVPAPDLDWSDSTPLSTVGMPYYRETLLSAWPTDTVYEVGAPPVKDNSQFLSTLQQREWGYYGKNTRGLRRNQAEDTRRLRNTKEHGLLNKPKFLSEQAREVAHTPAGTPAPEEMVPDPMQTVMNRPLESHKVNVPDLFLPIDIQFSKFGIDDFDFGFYNKTPYAGLQNHIKNCYANALLQVMFFTPAIRNIALQHTASRCLEELCLLCELGFLFDMLSKADGAPCHASNLLKIVSYHPQASNLGLLEELPRATTSRSHALQSFSRFILDKIAVDYKRIEPSRAMEQLLETTATSSIRCTNCGSETNKPASSFVHELMYNSNKTGQRHAKSPRVTFSQILKKSVERDIITKGWCQHCKRYFNLSSRKVTNNLPVVLTLHAGNISEDYRRLWATPGWLPEEIGVIVNNGQFFCYEGEDLKFQLQRGFHNITVFSLTALAVNIETGHNESHLITMANVAHSAPEAPNESQWYLLNDFHVVSIPTEEALSFNASWKMPSVITFQLKEANNKIDNTWKQRLDTSLLYLDIKPNVRHKTYRTLDADQEKVTSDTVIAIDTEFVSSSGAEIEITSDGEERTIRPTVHVLARASVLRSSGDDEGVPFIDDYVLIKEKVVDYLTAFSGIIPEDLDPRRTKHTLVPLKIVYKKMWILLNLGCKFLGHGLKQDFRVINMHVPRSQIIDTSDLFFQQAKKRKLGLQFLAWVLLSEDIQQETHDSIEDARTALRIYRKYQEFMDAGIFESMLQEVYQKGFAYNFKPPLKQGATVSRTETPPIDGVNGPSTPARGTVTATGVFGNSPSWTANRAASNLR